MCLLDAEMEKKNIERDGSGDLLFGPDKDEDRVLLLYGIACQVYETSVCVWYISSTFHSHHFL